MPRRLQSYETEDITVTFEPALCIHAAVCVRRLPEVFDTAHPRWIRPERAAAAEVARVVARCPTGALKYRLPAGPDEAAAEGPAEVRIGRDGPLELRGDVRIVLEDGRELAHGLRFALCRCGHTQSAPFCDGSHRRAGFFDP